MAIEIGFPLKILIFHDFHSCVNLIQRVYSLNYMGHHHFAFDAVPDFSGAFSGRAWRQAGQRTGGVASSWLWQQQSSLVGGLEHLLFSHIYGIIIPIYFHIFQRGSNHQLWLCQNSYWTWTMSGFTHSKYLKMVICHSYGTVYQREIGHCNQQHHRILPGQTSGETIKKLKLTALARGVLDPTKNVKRWSIILSRAMSCPYNSLFLY